MNIIKNNAPEFKKVKFHCDDCLNKKLNEFELIKNHLNHYNTTAIIGTMGSGKTSLTINLLKLFKKTFHKIYVFMPAYSRNSLDEKILDQLPEDQLFNTLDSASIDHVYQQVQEFSLQGMKTLIIYDDVQKSLKDPLVLNKLKNLIANQRHLKICNWILLQNWFSLHLSLREIINNVILFKLGKVQQEKIFNEVVELHKDKFDDIVNKVYDEPYQWLFINVGSQRIYKQFDELLLTDNTENL